MKSLINPDALIKAMAFGCLSLLGQNSHAETANNYYGTVVIKEYNGPRTCSFPITSRGSLTIKKKQEDNIPGCYFKFFENIQLIDTKSAVTLHFDGFTKKIDGSWIGGCNSPTEFRYRIYIKTVAAMGQTADFTIGDILSKDPEQVVVPGVKLVRKQEIGVPWELDMNEAFACMSASPSE